MTLRTPVIEMGVSNGAAVYADDLCEPIPRRGPLSYFFTFILPLASFSPVSRLVFFLFAE